MFNKGQSHGSRMLSLFKHPWAKNRTVDKLLVEDERQNLCGKSLLLMVHLSILRCAPCVWVGLSLVRPWCWELVSKCLRSKAPWCEIASDHWLNIKCLQENHPSRITVGPNLQKVTVVMPERPLTLLFRQGVLFFLAYCTHESQVFVQTSPWFSSRRFPDVLDWRASLMHLQKLWPLQQARQRLSGLMAVSWHA